MSTNFAITEEHKRAHTEFNKNDLRKELNWKGDHSRCEVGHADGECRSINAWRLNGECRIVPTVVGRPTVRRFQASVQYEGSGHEKEDEPVWQAKGWRLASETKFAKPIPEVVAKIRQHGIDNTEREMQHRKVSYTELKKAVEEFAARFDAANADLIPGAKIEAPSAPVTEKRGKRSDG